MNTQKIITLKKPNDKSFIIKIADKKFICVGENLVTFERNDKRVIYSSNLGYTDIKYAFAYGEVNISFMLHRKYIFIEQDKNSTERNEYEYLHKKEDELKGDVDNEGIVEYGNDFIKCKIILDY